MMQAFGKILCLSVLAFVLQMRPVSAWDECADIAKEGPNMSRNKGICAPAGPGNLSSGGKTMQELFQCRDDQGNIIEESRFENGVRTALWFYDPEGRRLTFAFHNGGKLHGPTRAFNSNGILTCELTFADGKQEGPVREYFADGKLRRSYMVKNGRREGRYVEYGANGGLVLEREYNNDADRVEKFYYPDGTLQEHSARRPDGKSFSTKNYWPNGKLQSEASFEVKTRPVCTLREAVRVGKAYRYAADGSLLEEARYDDLGRPDGVQIQVDEAGKRIESVYMHGKLMARKVFAANGRLEREEANGNGSLRP